MRKRSSKKIEDDLNILASSIVEKATGSNDKPREKNPAAVALGRLGGLKGGRVRAERLSAKRRKAIAQKAARARWQKKPERPA